MWNIAWQNNVVITTFMCMPLVPILRMMNMWFILSPSISLIYILILTSHLCLCFPHRLFPWGFRTKILYANCSTEIGTGYKLWSLNAVHVNRLIFTSMVKLAILFFFFFFFFLNSIPVTKYLCDTYCETRQADFIHFLQNVSCTAETLNMITKILFHVYCHSVYPWHTFFFVLIIYQTHHNYRNFERN
jgi:hypothetical protein